MNNRRGKTMKNRNEKSIEARLFRHWQGAIASADRFAVDHLDKLLKAFKWALGTQINDACGVESRLTAFDEEVFESYRRLAVVYRAVVQAFPDDEGEAREILEGVRSVLMARLMAAQDWVDGANPVLLEKKEIVAGGIKAASMQCDNLFHRFKLNYQRECIVRFRQVMTDRADYDTVLETLGGFRALALEHLTKQLYEIYCASSQDTRSALNNLSARPRAQYYYDLLLEEQQILAQIVKIQVQEIERRIAYEPCEAVLMLKEAYQRVCGEIAEIWGFFEGGQAGFEPESYEDIANVLETAEFIDERMLVDFEQMRSDFTPKYTKFLEACAEAATNQMAQKQGRAAKERVYYMRKAATEQSILIEEAGACFSDILAFYQGNNEVLATGEFAEIIAGIGETVKIKIDGMNEGLEMFLEESNGIIDHLANNEALGIPEDFAELISKAVAASLVDIGKDESKAQAVIREILDGRDICEVMQRQIEAGERSHTKSQEALEKACLRHLKDNLLFELTTFEEISYYSVSRLRESEDEAVALFVMEVDRQTAALEMILAKHGIEMIRPEAHDPFNAKEHEVLMAEVQEGFKKGEIIKVMNSGYKRGDAVVLRANVIAAR